MTAGNDISAYERRVSDPRRSDEHEEPFRDLDPRLADNGLELLPDEGRVDVRQ